jgi:hypothetical protein
VAVTFGAQLEARWTAALEPPFWLSLIRNYVILFVFAGAFYTQKVIAKRTQREGMAWLVAFSLLLIVGSVVERWIG